MTTLEDQIKAKLGIKYSAAKQLIEEAKANLEMMPDFDASTARDAEIIDEATQIFEDDLMPEEQEEMRVSGEVKSDFKQRAIAAAQRREAAAAAASAQPPAEQPAQQVVEQGVAEEQVKMQEEEVVEEYVVQEGEIEEGEGGETVTETVTTTVAEDGTQTITKKTLKKTVTEETGGAKVVVCCTIL